MPEPHADKGQAVSGLISPSLEARLRHFFGEQHRLRELLDRTRAELDRVNSELLAFQDKYCTDAAREEEYLSCLEKILGYDPRIDPREIEEAMANPHGIEDILEGLEKQAISGSDREAK
jgi:hypothetical protein